ncbi:MAG: hypothetical protein HC819_05150 [Cyclobacteriaceae bacterium]|nr:hypothetical protein [Cyclobacteriaceae bacterium]
MSKQKTLFALLGALLFFKVATLSAQTISSAELKLMTVLNTDMGAIPKELQASKTIVIISLADSGDQIRGDWEKVAKEAHYYIKKLSIDAVLYFYIDDLIAGYDVQLGVAAQLNARDVKNILMISRDVVDGRTQYIGVLTAYNQRPNFVSNNQGAWKSQTSDLEILFRNLARSIDNAGLNRENLLILDAPEYFHGVDIIKGKRFEAFNTDLRIDRVAIPKFEELPVPQNPGTPESEKLIAAIMQENEKSLLKNAHMEQFLADYPYKYEIIPYEYDEKKMLQKGFQFVLMRLNTSGRNVRQLLGYKVDDDVDALVTISKDKEENVNIKSIPIDAMVYKYYVKHINSGDIYLGEQWDGDDNWQDAFNNHLSGIIKKLEKK